MEVVVADFPEVVGFDDEPDEIAAPAAVAAEATDRAIERIGITTGAVYALIALGYTMVYGIIELINFAHGEVFMIGAYLAFKEPMRWERWVAVALGFGGVLIVVGPKLSASGGWYHLVMLASAPVFAVSFLLTKAMTRYETAGVILVWQSITVSIITLPLALWMWAPLSGWQWAGFLVAGFLGSGGHYCLTRSFAAADISATQSAKFLDLVWSALMGFLLFADIPSHSTMLGGVLIASATLWLARRESSQARKRNAAEVEAEAEASGSP